jgi:hypothetical protein
LSVGATDLLARALQFVPPGVNLVVADFKTHAVGWRNPVVLHAPLVNVRVRVVHVLVGIKEATVHDASDAPFFRTNLRARDRP